MPTYQLKLTLKDSNPVIWRRILIPSNLLLTSFHNVIQKVMKWDNCHLYEFTHQGRHYGPNTDGDPIVSASVTFEKQSIEKLLKAKKDKMKYIYDFGDCWEVDIVLEKIITDNEVKYPTYVAGEMAAPPEDCGGMCGFYNLLKILDDPKHPDHDEMVDWNGDFDPNYIDTEYIKEKLTNTNFEYSKPKTAVQSQAVKERIAKVRELVNRFCDEKLNNEYKQACNRLIDDLVNETDFLEKRSKTESVACSIVCAVGLVNYLYDPESEIHLPEDQLYVWFGTKEATVDNKVNEIMDELILLPLIGPYALPSIANDPKHKKAFEILKGLCPK